VVLLSERQIRWALAGTAAGSFALLLTLEVTTEQHEISLLDFLSDAASLLLTITSAVGVGLLVQRMQVQHEEKMALIRDLEAARTEGAKWRSKVRSDFAGIKVEMDSQFQQWGMTDAEKDVGLLILKGLSHKEIAALRGTSEATVRQQAQSIYRKSKMPGKTAFSAYFLEDLFSPGAKPSNVGADSQEEKRRRGDHGPSADLHA
jgi:DNA-binding CsgD family transcriptional regulator